MPGVLSKPLQPEGWLGPASLNQSQALLRLSGIRHLAANDAFNAENYQLAKQQCQESMKLLTEFNNTLHPKNAKKFYDVVRIDAGNRAILARCLLKLKPHSEEIAELIEVSFKLDSCCFNAYVAFVEYFLVDPAAINPHQLKVRLINGLYAHNNIEIQHYVASMLYELHGRRDINITLSNKQLKELFKFADQSDIPLMMAYASFLFETKQAGQEIVALCNRLLAVCDDDDQRATLYYYLGNLYYFWENGKDILLAREYFEKATTLGQAAKTAYDLISFQNLAQFSLACILDEHDSTPQERAHAIELYEAAAAQQHLGAIHNLGFKYYYGEDVEQNCEKGLQLFRQVVSLWETLNQPSIFEDSVKRAYENLVDHYYRLGEFDAAEQYAKLGLEQGSVNCQMYLEDIYFTQRRYCECLSMMKDILKYAPNSAAILFNIALMYEAGQGMDAPDLAEAEQYFIRSIRQGSTEALYRTVQFLLAGVPQVTLTVGKLLQIIDESMLNADEAYESVLSIAREMLTLVNRHSSKPVSQQIASPALMVEEAGVIESRPAQNLTTIIESIYADTSFSEVSRINWLLNFARHQSLSSDDIASMVKRIGILFNATTAPHRALKVKSLMCFRHIICDNQAQFTSWQLCSLFFGLKQLLVSPDDPLLMPIIEVLCHQLHNKLQQHSHHITCNHRIYLLTSITRLLPCQHSFLQQVLALLVQQSMSLISAIHGREMFILIHQLAVIHHYQKDAFNIAAITPLIQHCIAAIKGNNNVRSLSQAMLAFSYLYHCLGDSRINLVMLTALQSQVATLQSEPTESLLQKRLTACCKQIDPRLKTEVMVHGCLPVDIQLHNGVIIQVHGPNHYLVLGLNAEQTQHLLSCHDTFKMQIIGQPNNLVVILAYFAEPTDQSSRIRWIKNAITNINSHSQNPYRLTNQMQNHNPVMKQPNTAVAPVPDRAH